MNRHYEGYVENENPWSVWEHMGKASEVFQVHLNQGSQFLDMAPSHLEKELSEKRPLPLS